MNYIRYIIFIFNVDKSLISNTLSTKIGTMIHLAVLDLYFSTNFFKSCEIAIKPSYCGMINLYSIHLHNLCHFELMLPNADGCSHVSFTILAPFIFEAQITMICKKIG